MKAIHFLPVLLVPSCIVALPAAAMLFQLEGWAWSGFDFVVAWVFLAGAVGAYQFAARKAPNRAYRAAAAVAVATGLVLLWVNGAVGIIGSEDNPANFLYAAVFAIGLIGTVLARLRPLGMARVLIATAVAQFVVPIIALVAWRADFSPGVVPVFGLNFGFVLLLVCSALLFRRAAGKRESAP